VSPPDVARLSRLTDDDLRAFRDRLRAIALDVEAVDRAMLPGRALPPVLREPLVRWHARHAPGEAGLVIRAFVADDPVSEADLVRAFGVALFEALLGAGLLERTAAGVASPYHLAHYDETLVFVDRLTHGVDAIVASPVAPALMAAAYPPARIGSVLDLGCGAGGMALVLAANAERVVAVDDDPRALALARFNARLNGVRNLELLDGEAFARLGAQQGQAFELVTSLPSFDAFPAQAGGHGDERAALRLVAAARQLQPGGRAILYAEWLELESEPPIQARLRARLDPLDAEVDLLVLLAPATALDERCIRAAAAAAPALDARWAQLCEQARENLQRVGARATRPSLTVLRRRAAPGATGGTSASSASSAPAPLFTTAVEIGPLSTVQPSSARIGRLLATRDLLATSDSELLSAKLRIPPKTTIVSEREASDPGATLMTHARFSPRAMLPPLGLNDEAVTLAQLVHQTGSIAEALAFYQRTLGVDAAAARTKLLPHARDALERGLLEPVPGG
jgi:precorrin-6B methylase 2